MKIVKSAFALLILLIVLMVGLNLLQKVPGVGKLAKGAKSLATEGDLKG